MQIKKFKPQDHKIKAVIYWPSGSGKTTFGSTAPKPVFASSENWLLSIAEKSPDYVEIKSLKDLKDFLKDLQKEDHWFQSVVIDSITDINEIIKTEIETRTWRQMQLQDWGKVAKEIKSILRGFKALPMHTIFIAQEQNVKDEEKIAKIVPSLNWKAASEIAYYMDIVAYTFIDKTWKHQVITTPSPTLLTKDRTNKIWNNTEPDFSVWAALVALIETWDEEIVADYKENEDKPLPQPVKKAVPMIKPNQIKQLMTVWSKFWKLSMELKADYKDSTWKLVYFKENAEPMREAMMINAYKTNSSTKLTFEQACDFIEKLSDRVKDLEAEKKEAKKSEEITPKQAKEILTK